MSLDQPLRVPGSNGTETLADATQAPQIAQDMLFSDEPMSGNDFTLRLPNYEGPLDVLLRLIEERQMEITAVSIASVADQFLAHMETLSARDPRTLSNFVSVAARLILLKSRALLPHLTQSDENDDNQGGDDLVQQLRAYQLFKRTARWLLARETAGIRSYAIQPPPVERPQSLTLPLDNVTVSILAKVMQRVVDRWLPPPPVDNVVSRLPFTVNDCIQRIESAIEQSPTISFTDVLVGVNLRVEIIINLLALLELLKRNVIVAYQDQLFGEIMIEKAPPLPVEPPAMESASLEPDIAEESISSEDELSDTAEQW